MVTDIRNRHGSHQHLVLGDGVGQVFVGAGVSVKIGPHGDKNKAAVVWNLTGMYQPVEKQLPFALVVAQGKDLFKLVNHQHKDGLLRPVLSKQNLFHQVVQGFGPGFKFPAKRPQAPAQFTHKGPG